jgi:hypothetical protein
MIGHIALSAILGISAPADPGNEPATRGQAYTVRDATPEPSAEYLARMWEENARVHYWCGSCTSPGDVDRWYWTFRDAGWPIESMPWVYRMIDCESDGDPDSYNGVALGLMQIHRTSWRRTGNDLGMPSETWVDPTVNARMALVVYAAQGATAWQCHKIQGRPDPVITRDQAALIVASWAI